MTKNEYEHAKIINLREFINSLESQLMTGTITGRNKIAQAKRQLKQAKLKINEYMVNFWNESNEYCYDILYKNKPLVDRKKDVSIW